MLRIGLEADRLTLSDRSGMTSHLVGVLNGFKEVGLMNSLTLFLDRQSENRILPVHRNVVAGYRIERFTNSYKHAHRIRMRLCPYGRQNVFQFFSTLYDPVQPHRLNSFLIPDLTAVQMPDCHLPANREYWLRYFDKITSHPGLLLTYSEHTKQEAIKHFNLNPERVVAIPLGYGAEYHQLPIERVTAAIRPLGLVPGQYILNVGTLEPRKNHTLLFRAYAKLKSRGLVRGIPLVLSGGRGWLYETSMAELNRLDLQGDVRFVGFVDCLPELYSGATVMVYPSLYEGFGLPPLEAMACGTPVIVSNTSSLPEVVGPDGVSVNPDDVDGLAEAITRILSDTEYRRDLSKKGLMRASHFSWGKCAQSMYNAYESAIKNKI